MPRLVGVVVGSVVILLGASGLRAQPVLHPAAPAARSMAFRIGTAGTRATLAAGLRTTIGTARAAGPPPRRAKSEATPARHGSAAAKLAPGSATMAIDQPRPMAISVVRGSEVRGSGIKGNVARSSAAAARKPIIGAALQIQTPHAVASEITLNPRCVTRDRRLLNADAHADPSVPSLVGTKGRCFCFVPTRAAMLSGGLADYQSLATDSIPAGTLRVRRRWPFASGLVMANSPAAPAA